MPESFADGSSSVGFTGCYIGRGPRWVGCTVAHGPIWQVSRGKWAFCLKIWCEWVWDWAFFGGGNAKSLLGRDQVIKVRTSVGTWRCVPHVTVTNLARAHAAHEKVPNLRGRHSRSPVIVPSKNRRPRQPPQLITQQISQDGSRRWSPCRHSRTYYTGSINVKEGGEIWSGTSEC